MYIAPFVILTYLNSRLIRTLNEIRLRKEALTGHRVRDDHITMIIVVIVITFILCQTPALVNQIFWATIPQSGRECGYFHFYYTKISDVLVVLNSSTNFLIYCLFGKSFRRVFVEVLCRRSVYRARRGDPSSQPLRELWPARSRSLGGNGRRATIPRLSLPNPPRNGHMPIDDDVYVGWFYIKTIEVCWSKFVHWNGKVVTLTTL